MTQENTFADSDSSLQQRLARIVADPEARRDYEESLQRRIKAAREHLARVQGDPRLFDSGARTEAQIRLDQAEAELLALQDAEWTRELTIQRRAAWNAALKDPKYHAGRVVFYSAIERDLGFSLDVLRRQVQRWGLTGDAT
jgi:DNA repair exonuclease SbcCD ATPase subunit